MDVAAAVPMCAFKRLMLHSKEPATQTHPQTYTINVNGKTDRLRRSDAFTSTHVLVTTAYINMNTGQSFSAFPDDQDWVFTSETETHLHSLDS